MKILFINTFIHRKNHHALKNYKNIEIYEINHVENIYSFDLSFFDCVFSPSQPIDVSRFPNTIFIFGPHFSVFPDSRFDTIKGANSIYNVLSEWNLKVHQSFPICDEINIVKIPFGVDTYRFCEIQPLEKRETVFVYFKQRNPLELDFLKKYLDSKNIKYNLFSYEGRYKEEDYIRCLQNAKYGIWLGRHESQGFALEEALSCNVPLLVWDVRSMNQEIGQNYHDIPSTSIPYWDERCGKFFYNVSELDETFKSFLSTMETYKPREYILENLSFEICEKKWINEIKNISKTKNLI
jgi:hypothetical protein